MTIKDILKISAILISGLWCLKIIKKFIGIKLSTVVPVCFYGGIEKWNEIVERAFAFPSGHVSYYTFLFFPAIIYIGKRYFRTQEMLYTRSVKRVLVWVILALSLFLWVVLVARVKICGYHTMVDILGGLVYSICYFYLMDFLIKKISDYVKKYLYSS